MSKIAFKDINKNGVNPTLYDSRNKFDNIDFSCKLETLQTSLRKQDTRNAFSHCITPIQEREQTDSMFGNYYFGSPLSYHLLVSTRPVETGGAAATPSPGFCYLIFFLNWKNSVKVKNSIKLKTSWNSPKVTNISNITIDLDTRDGILSVINCERFSHF